MFTEIIMEQMNCNNQEIIHEFRVDSGYGMYIEVDGNDGRNGGGYFKVYNNENKNGADAMIRINVDSTNPDYVYHANPSLPGNKNKLKDFNMSSKDRENLVKILSRDGKWHELLDDIVRFQHVQIDDIDTRQVPDYTKLKYDKHKSKN